MITLEEPSIEVMHADAHCVVVNKPSGLLSVPGRGADKQDCASQRVRSRFSDALIVHRLDMATSGLLLFARGIEAQRKLSAAFATRAVHKRYIAVVAGAMAHAEGSIDLPLSADWPNRPRQRVDHEGGRPSVTRWKNLHYDAANDTSRLELEPITGRAHQLRVHLLSIGHPIVGDALYGDALGADASAQRAAPRLLLHASMLQFAHPASGEPMQFDSPPPF